MAPLRELSPHARDAVAADLPAIVAIYNATIPGGMVTADTSPVSVEDRVPWFRAHAPDRRPIWVVDDEAGLRDMLTFGLTDRGYRVVCAASGEAKAMMPRAPMAARTLPVMPVMPDSPAGASPYLTGLGRRR